MEKWNAPKVEELNVEKTEFIGELVEDLLGCGKPEDKCCPGKKS